MKRRPKAARRSPGDVLLAIAAGYSRHALTGIYEESPVVAVFERRMAAMRPEVVRCWSALTPHWSPEWRPRKALLLMGRNGR